MSVLAILGIAVVGATAGVLLREYHPSLSLCLSVGTGIFLLVGCVGDLFSIVNSMKELLAKTTVETTFFGILLKTLGICYLCQFAGDLCKDAGETALAGYVELAGKILVVGLSLPFIAKVVETVVKLIEV